MGKLAIMSDLHVDINHLTEREWEILAELLIKAQITHFHLAGDTANKASKALEVVEYFQDFFPTTFNWGNHEMVGLTEKEINDFSHAAFLNLKTVSLTANLVLLGYNGWYDYGFASEKDPAKIIALKNLYWYDRNIIRSKNDPEVDAEQLHQLKQCLLQLQSENKTVILATHFVPKKAFIVEQKNPKWLRWNQLNAFLGSKALGELLDEFSNISHVVFGHTHRHFPRQQINQTSYHCQPFGYFFEWQLTRDFVLKNQLVQQVNPMKLRGVLKRNQVAF
ncbi:MAG: metallophosphoesterase, partial [Enterococcus sp.]